MRAYASRRHSAGAKELLILEGHSNIRMQKREEFYNSHPKNCGHIHNYKIIFSVDESALHASSDSPS
jgi:hypothetical protein